MAGKVDDPSKSSAEISIDLSKVKDNWVSDNKT